MSGVSALVRFGLVCADPEAAAGFYQAALGFERTGAAALRLGGQAVELIRAEPSGQPVLGPVSGRSLAFQHLAIVTADMAAAHGRLQARAGWTAMSEGGPQRLPASSGDVVAFKFADPEGHPLELIAFAPGRTPDAWRGPAGGRLCLGIDHSAISVADTGRSVAFYRDLGLDRTGGSFNQGPEQDRLDGMAGVHVEVTALSPPQAPPHVELLAYRGHAPPTGPPPGLRDLLATRLVFQLDDAAAVRELCARRPAAVAAAPALKDGTWSALLRDPDGHLVALEAPAAPPRRRGGP